MAEGHPSKGEDKHSGTKHCIEQEVRNQMTMQASTIIALKSSVAEGHPQRASARPLLHLIYSLLFCAMFCHWVLVLTLWEVAFGHPSF